MQNAWKIPFYSLLNIATSLTEKTKVVLLTTEKLWRAAVDKNWLKNETIVTYGFGEHCDS